MAVMRFIGYIAPSVRAESHTYTCGQMTCIDKSRTVAALRIDWVCELRNELSVVVCTK